MRLGRAYKIAAVAAAHKARAIALLDAGDHAGATREEVAYIACIEDIPSRLRQTVLPFVDDCAQTRLQIIKSSGALA